MNPTTEYPRVLFVALGRINATDSANNGLLLRSLFGAWPRERMAQIYSSGSSGDEGAFGLYYELGPKDRRLGHLFYRVKTTVQAKSETETQTSARPQFSLRALAKRLFLDTGLYEVICPPRVSLPMQSWVQQFRPDIIFAQGYNLTFAALPVLLKETTHARLALFVSDDWPTYLYSGLLGESRFFWWLIGRIIRRAVSRLLDATDVPLAFGHCMAEEYEARYGKAFTVLSHSDDPRRFAVAQPIRVHPAGMLTMMAVGNFNRFRWPLLLDANESCRLLNAQGMSVRLAVLASGIDPEGARRLAAAPFIDILEDPGNEALPCYLKGADLLLLAEGFDEGFVSAIRLSISSKAHLFMFSQRPIIVYAHPETGVAKYATSRRWARVVSTRDPQSLTEAIRDLLVHPVEAKALVSRAIETSLAFHSRDANQKLLFSAMTSDGYSKE